MIRFYGEINNESQKFIAKKMLRLGLYVMIVLLIVVGFPSILAGVFFDIWFFTIFTGMGMLVSLFLSYYTRKDYYPNLITIDNNQICAEIGKGMATRTFDDVKQIIDYGEFYDIIFYFPNKVLNCICQKDLIQEGTIEDFEELFKDYIVRKYKS